MKIKSVSMDFFYVFGLFSGVVYGVLSLMKLAGKVSSNPDMYVSGGAFLGSFFGGLFSGFISAVAVGILINWTLKIIGGWEINIVEKTRSVFEKENERIIKRNIEILKKNKKL